MKDKRGELRTASWVEPCLAASVVGLVIAGAAMNPALGVQVGLAGIGLLLNIRATIDLQVSERRVKKRSKNAVDEAVAAHPGKVVRFVSRAERLEQVGEVRAAATRPRSS